METLYYPVIFHPEAEGYSTSVPDLEGCFSQGDTLAEAIGMVTDAIGLFLEGMEEVPAASDPASCKVTGGDFLMVIPFDRLAYQKKHNTKAVKKTLSIPAWLNEAAEAAHVNFSGILQEALKEHLGI